MWTRRRFLGQGLGVLGLTGTALALPSETRESLPDGSASKGMITPEAEQAIDKGLRFLADAQRQLRTGEFGTHAYQGNVAVTSLAALAFMAGGHQPGRGMYGRVVSDALKFVLGTEGRAPAGYLYNARGTPHGPMYGHGFGTLFLAEVCGMVPDPRLRDDVRGALKRAVQLILDSQNIEGGWRYFPNSRDADISVTICQIMALRAARNAGIAVPKSQVDKCVAYVRKCQDRSVGFFRYMAQGGGGEQQAFARTAAGVCALFSAGVYEGEDVHLALEYLMRHKPPGQQFRGMGNDMHYFYGHYYAAQAMWTAGGKYWQEWFPAIREELLARQTSSGYWQDQICIHYGTAMACIILQIPNNYLPILQK
jgi:hypothetical protein